MSKNAYTLKVEYFPGYEPSESARVRRMRTLASKSGLRLEKRRGPLRQFVGVSTGYDIPPYRLWRYESRRGSVVLDGVRSRTTLRQWRMVIEGTLDEVQQYLEEPR